MSNDGINAYLWDAENRLVEIDYPGSGNNSQFTYDGQGHCVKIVETVGGTATSTKQFIWCDDERCEVRDASGAVTAQYFDDGQTIAGSNYYYLLDHLGSIRALTDSTGATRALYQYDPYGRVAKIQGDLDSDLQYARYYFHLRSGLSLTVNRAYSAQLGRWISRDPIGERGGINLYEYVVNDPIDFVDRDGLNISRGGPVEAPTRRRRDWPHTWPPGGGGGGGGDEDPADRCKRRKKKPGDDAPPPPPPPPPFDGGDNNDCKPPKSGTDPKVRTMVQCLEWCENNCPPEKISRCYGKCFDDEGYYD